jgi:Leucine-rich repeat (LRR) protein
MVGWQSAQQTADRALRQRRGPDAVAALASLASDPRVAPRLRHLDLRNTELGADGYRAAFALLRHFTALETLQFGGRTPASQAGNAGLAALTAEVPLLSKRMTRFGLSDNNAGSFAPLLTALAEHLPHTDVLDMSRNKVATTEYGTIVAVLPRFPQLMWIDMPETAKGEPHVLTLAEHMRAGAFPALAELLLGGCECGDEGTAAIAEALPSVPQLTGLSLSNNRLTEAGFETIFCAIKHVPRLSWLALHNNWHAFGSQWNSTGGISEAVTIADSLRASPHPSLAQLTLRSTKFHVKHIAALVGALRDLPQLAVLDLQDCALGDAAVIAVATALRRGAAPHLTTLNLRDNGIQSEGAKALASAFASGNMKKLQALDLNDNKVRPN